MQRARGLALAALARYYGETRRRGDAAAVELLVGGQQVARLELNGESLGQAIEVPAELVDSDRVRLELRYEGRGELFYAASLSGFTRDVARKDHPRLLVNQHTYTSPGPMYAGREMGIGFSSVSEVEGWINEVSELPAGRIARARVDYYRRWNSGEDSEEDIWLEVEVPLPAGASVLSESVSGNFQHWEQQGDRLVFHIGRQRNSGSLRYTLVGKLPGSYRVLPVTLRNVYDPEEIAWAEAKQLTVLPRGAQSGDAYRATPDELYQLGQAQYADGAHAAAWENLTQLWEGFGEHLRSNQLRDTATMMLFLSIAREESRSIVSFFEVLKEKDPDLYVPFDQVLAVGRAYRELEEWERALHIFRATVEETFGKDLGLAWALEEQGEFQGAMGVLERLWQEFPDLPVVVESSLTVADKLLTKAPSAHADERLSAAGFNKEALQLRGILGLQRFLALYPESQLAPDAGLSLVSAHIDLEDYETASELAARFAARYSEPRYADAFLYTQAVADWHMGSDDQALGLLRRIAEAVYTDERGVERSSENRELAYYILGQIHHAARQPEQAIEYYELVSTNFPDAAEAVANFRQREIGLDEVTVVRPDEPARLVLHHRNLEAADLLVYSVDLMTLYLREKNLSGVTNVNLAGIEPVVRRTVALEQGADLRAHETTVELELPDEGAYLVMCRGEELHTSGLVLVSPLELEVREDPVSGRLRVEVLDSNDGAYVRGVDVKVVGSSSQQFVSGRTDPRGLFVADGIQGAATVIARQGANRYAFYRGSTQLGSPAQTRGGGGRGFFGGEQSEILGEQEYLRNVLEFNREQQGSRLNSYREEANRARNGVQVRQVQ